MSDGIELFEGDCLDVMPQIPDGSVDLILTDPPYGTIKGMADGDGNVVHGMQGKTEWDEEIDLEMMLDQCNRILRTNGGLILFSQDPYTGKLMTQTHGNLPFSYRMTWLKDHFANSLIAKVTPVNYTEDICVFFKKYDTLNEHPLRKYSKRIMDHIDRKLKEINSDLGHRGAEHFFYIKSTQFWICDEKTYDQIIEFYGLEDVKWMMSYEEILEIDHRFSRCFNLPKGKKFKSNVLEFKKDYTGLHPTQKPVALIEDLIRTYMNEGDMVLDFTMGSGTTGVVCKNLNRRFTGIELDPEYFKIAKDRIENVTTRQEQLF